MTGILILAHGSRDKSAEDTIKKIISMLKKKMDNCIIEYAFLQFSQLTIQKGLDNLVDKGVKDIKIIPYFLFDGIHIRENIPREVEDYLKNNPDIKVSLGKTLGSDKRLAEILVDRIKEIE
mgnify:FL=1